MVGVGLHLFRLYDNPEDWGSEKKVSALVACEVGVFDIEKIKPWLLAATNFHAVNEVLDDWP